MSDAHSVAPDRPYIRMERREHTALLTIDRPDVRNALSESVRRELAGAIQAADADPNVRAIILTGAGEDAFASGADIGEMGRRTLDAQRAMMRDGGIFGIVARVRKPVIAAINGYCLGGGLELALACDIRIASQTARFGQPEVKLGLIPGGGGTQMLPRVVGMGHAMRLVLTGDSIDAAEALRIGLIQEIVPSATLAEHAYAIAQTLAARSPVALAAAKEAVRTALDLPLTEGRLTEAALFERCFTSDDKTEGIRAFLDKRVPHFPGR
jgi:enoyl-CoA hydratase